MAKRPPPVPAVGSRRHFVAPGDVLEDGRKRGPRRLGMATVLERRDVGLSCFDLVVRFDDGAVREVSWHVWWGRWAHANPVPSQGALW